jgi:AP-4 complex subunit epsilon-1
MAVLARLVGILATHKAPSDRLRCSVITSLSKLAEHTGGAAGPVGRALLQPHDSGGATAIGTGSGPGLAAADLVHKCLSSQCLELQQRARELQALLGCARRRRGGRGVWRGTCGQGRRHRSSP